MTLLLVTLLVWSQVEFRTTDGDSVVGELRGWNDEAIRVECEGATRQIPLERLQLWRALDDTDDRSDVATIMVELCSGSRLAGQELGAHDGTLELTTINGPMRVAMRDVQWIRLRPASNEWDTEWQRIVGSPFAGDALVIRRGSRRLDFLEGSIRRVTAESVEFTYDDQVIDVPRSRLEGLVCFQPEPPVRAAPAFVVSLRDGSRWNGLGAELIDGQLRVRLAQDYTVETTLANITEVSFASGNLSYISDLVPEQVVVEPLWVSQFARKPVESFLYQPQWNRGFAGRDLQLRIDATGARQSFEKGIALHGQTRLLFRLSQPFRELRGLAGFDPELGQHGSARLTIRADGAELFSEDIPRGGPPLAIAVPLAEPRRLEIELSPLDGFDAGDFVNLCHFRLMK